MMMQLLLLPRHLLGFAAVGVVIAGVATTVASASTTGASAAPTTAARRVASTAVLAASLPTPSGDDATVMSGSASAANDGAEDGVDYTGVDSSYEREQRVLRALERLEKISCSSSEASTSLAFSASSDSTSSSSAHSSTSYTPPTRSWALGTRTLSSEHGRDRQSHRDKATDHAAEDPGKLPPRSIESTSSRGIGGVVLAPAATASDAELPAGPSGATNVTRLPSSMATGGSSAASMPSLRALSAPTASARDASAAATSSGGIKGEGVTNRTSPGGSCRMSRHEHSEGMTSLGRMRRFLHGISTVDGDGLVPVPLDYLTDPFNLAQLPAVVEEIGRFYLRNDGISAAQPQQEHPFPMYRRALDLLVVAVSMGSTSPDDDHIEDVDEETDNGLDDGQAKDSDEAVSCRAVERTAIALYLLVHQRYVASPRGLEQVRRRFFFGVDGDDGSHRDDRTGAAPRDTPDATSSSSPPSSSRIHHLRPAYGRCPNRACRGYPLLPYGESEAYTLLPIQDPDVTEDFNSAASSAFPGEPSQPRLLSRNRTEVVATVPFFFSQTRAQRYCASCRQVYCHWPSKVDGCAWGPSFCHLFLLAFADSSSEDVPSPWSDSACRGAETRTPPESANDESGGTDHRQQKGTDSVRRRNDIEPRIFGFRVHPKCYQSAVDQWFRVD